jgi:hypothetical protein
MVVEVFIFIQRILIPWICLSSTSLKTSSLVTKPTLTDIMVALAMVATMDIMDYLIRKWRNPLKRIPKKLKAFWGLDYQMHIGV